MASKKRKNVPRKPIDINAQILAALKDGALSTKQLATELGITPGSIYSRCTRLEEKGLLKSKLVTGHGPMYCIDDDKVVDRSDYEKCREEGHELRPIEKKERVWSLA